MNRKIILEFLCFLFVLLFIYTGVSKLMTFAFFYSDLSQSPILGKYSTLLAYTVPLLEILIAIGLMIPFTRRISLYLFIAMMVGFTGYIAYMLAYSDYRPCTCGGVIREMTWRQHMVFNAGFIVLAILALRLHKKQNQTSVQNTISTT